MKEGNAVFYMIIGLMIRGNFTGALIGSPTHSQAGKFLKPTGNLATGIPTRLYGVSEMYHLGVASLNTAVLFSYET